MTVVEAVEVRGRNVVDFDSNILEKFRQFFAPRCTPSGTPLSAPGACLSVGVWAQLGRCSGRPSPTRGLPSSGVVKANRPLVCILVRDCQEPSRPEIKFVVYKKIDKSLSILMVSTATSWWIWPLTAFHPNSSIFNPFVLAKSTVNISWSL